MIGWAGGGSEVKDRQAKDDREQIEDGIVAAGPNGQLERYC